MIIGSVGLLIWVTLLAVLAAQLLIGLRYLNCRRLKRELDESNRRWNLLADNSQLHIFTSGANGCIDSANPYLLAICGYTGGDLTGRPVRELLPGAEAWLTELRDGDSSTRPVELQLRTKSGAFRNVVWSGFALGSSGGALRAISIGIDVSGVSEAETARDRAIVQMQELRRQIECEGIAVEDVESVRGPAYLLGESAAMKYVLRKIEQVAKTDATVLIEGETGVGKELVARALHELSGRARGPFVRVNCAALPVTLIESELFGHEKGAFTGADRFRKGRFELAEGGTLFLDEIGELPLEMQVKLLRVLQEGEYERLGDSTTRRTNVRVISATNRNLRDEIAEGRFREDLYYRLQVYPITVPPLRDRRDDIAPLTLEFVKRFSRKHRKNIDQIPGHVLEELRSRPWPGNVRELMNVIEQAVITTNGPNLVLPKPAGSALRACPAPEADKHLTSLATVEKNYILKVLAQTGGKIAGPGGAAEILEMHPNTLRARMEKLGIHRRATERGLAAAATA